jgi:hypothetical protein
MQVARTSEANIDFGLVCHGHDRLAFDSNRLVRAAAAHGKVIDYAGRLHTRGSPNPLEYALEEGDLGGGSGKLVGRNRDGHREDAVGVEAGLHVTELP